MRKSKWVLVGGDTLIGKEIRELVEERKLPVALSVLSSETQDRILAESEGELSVIEPLSAESLQGACVAFLAGTRETNRQAAAMARGMKAPPALVDLHGEFEDLPESRLREPLLESAPLAEEHGVLFTLPHPAASALARLFTSIHERFPIAACVVTALEPASVHGKAGLEELHQQTVNLFSFHALPKKVFDAQAAFNLLPRYGEEAPSPLSASEQRMERHLASLLGPRGIPMPSLRVIHAPVFHGYCQSVWLRFGKRPAQAELEHLLKEAGVDIRTADLDPASNVAVADQSGLIVSDIAEDRSDPRAIWLFLVSDNLRTLADNALLIAALASREVT